MILNIYKAAKTPCFSLTTESTFNSGQPEYLHSPQMGLQGNQQNAGKNLNIVTIILKVCVMVN